MFWDVCILGANGATRLQSCAQSDVGCEVCGAGVFLPLLASGVACMCSAALEIEAMSQGVRGRYLTDACRRGNERRLGQLL